MQILVTNGGPHPADKWAAASAAAICNLIVIDDNSASEAAVAARLAKPKLESAIVDALMGHHHEVQKHERAQLDKHGHERLSHSLDPRDHVPKTLNAAMKAVGACFDASPFKAHFAQAHVQEAIAGMLGSHFASAMQIERSWHADGHVVIDGRPVKNHRHDPDNHHVKAFRARHGHAA